MTTPPTSGRSSARSALSELPALIVACWLVLGALFLLLVTTVDGTIWRDTQLPKPMRDGLAMYGLAGLVPAAVLVGALAWGYRRLLAWPLVAGGTARWAVRVAFWGVLGGLALLWLTSWLSLHGTGRFLGVEGIRFLLASPLQTLQHALHLEPMVILALPLAAAALALLLGHLAPRAVSWCPARAQWGIALAGAVAFYWCIDEARVIDRISLTFRETIWDPAYGTSYELRDYYAAARDERTSPIAHLAVELRAGSEESPEGFLESDRVRATNAPLVTLEEWAAAADSARTRPLNVIVVVIESLRSDQLRAYGGRRTVMPTVEALARDGRVFTDHVTTSSQSNLACIVPVSGHYPLRDRRFHVYPENPSYPRVQLHDLLKTVGYRTAVISSQNETWGGMLHYLRTDRLDHLMHAETFEGPTYVPVTDFGFARFVQSSKRSGKIDDRHTVGEAIEWIDGGGSEPFFIYMNLQNSHVPYEVPEEFPRRFGGGRPSFTIWFNNFPVDSAAVVRDVYANSLAYVDAQLARLVEHLRERGLWDSTVLVVTGDHGQAFYEHGFAAHGNRLYEELTRTPLVIRAPGLAPGADGRPAQHVDVAPSVMHLLGLPQHPSFQGEDLFSPRPDPDRSRYIVVQTPNASQAAIIRGRYKLIYDAWDHRRFLYDLARDPLERYDLSEKLPLVSDDLMRRLDSWRSAQLEYYATPAMQARYYPPRIEEIGAAAEPRLGIRER